MKNGIPNKGKVLNAISLFWFDQLSDICENHLITANVDEMYDLCCVCRSLTVCTGHLPYSSTATNSRDAPCLSADYKCSLSRYSDCCPRSVRVAFLKVHWCCFVPAGHHSGVHHWISLEGIQSKG